MRHRIAAKDIIFQDAGERPVHAAVGGITPTGLPEVGLNTVELSPADHHLVEICRINRNRGLVRSVPEDIVAIRIDIRLVTGEHAELRDHSRRSLYRSRRSRWVIVFLERLSERRLANGRELPRSGGKPGERTQTDQEAYGRNGRRSHIRGYVVASFKSCHLRQAYGRPRKR